jgi:hypothetical protein
VTNEIGQTIYPLASLQNDARAIAAVAAIGATSGNIFLATKTHAAIATATGLEFNFDEVNKHGVRNKKRNVTSPGDAAEVD